MKAYNVISFIDAHLKGIMFTYTLFYTVLNAYTNVTLLFQNYSNATLKSQISHPLISHHFFSPHIKSPFDCLSGLKRLAELK